MPQSVTIAAFVFGAVLLLIALVGGGFSIFGAEVKEQVGPFRRMIAGVTGGVLLLIAFAPNAQSPPAPPAPTPAAAESKPPARAHTARSAPTARADTEPPVPAATPAERSVASLAGEYRLISAYGRPVTGRGSMHIDAVGDGSYKGQYTLTNMYGVSNTYDFLLHRADEDWLLEITPEQPPDVPISESVEVTLKDGVLKIREPGGLLVWRRL